MTTSEVSVESEMVAPAGRERLWDALALAALVAWVVGWIWPIGVSGRMPVGGDVTQFQIGLMAEYDRALADGRLPLWNADWGFGFPALAESQMGVYYPPHVVLYGLFNTETAYTLSLMGHLIWGAWGAWWLARVMGVSRVGAVLAGVAWSGCGFQLIHLSHQWAYTVGSWMPWAWGLGWRVSRGVDGWRGVLGLACVLAVQVLPGHFQIAFITQVTVLVLGVAALIGERQAWRHGVGLLLALSLMFPLAACQLWPTWQLARRAEIDRTYEYLSGFATSWVHLATYVGPRLFHGSPLWRPIAWDPLRTSPEEHLGYVGLVPLVLAIAACWGGWRVDRRVRAIVAVVGVSLWLSLGPNVPGFGWLIQLPGFSFFRAPARWGGATMLGLAVLAGMGWDRFWKERGGLLVRRVGIAVGLLAIVLPLVLIGTLELGLALTSSRPPGWMVETGRLFGASIPLPEGAPVVEWLAPARHATGNPIVVGQLRRLGMDESATFVQQRGAIYLAAAAGTAPIAFAMLILLLGLARNRKGLAFALIGLTVIDLGLLGRHRGIEDAPMRPLVEQSPVLARLAELTREDGGRTLDPFGNLGMVAGAAPVLSYRTLDLEALPGHTLQTNNSARERFLCDVRHLLSAPEGEGYWGLVDREQTVVEEIEDPALARWIYGRAWLASQKIPFVTFRTRTITTPSSRAFLLVDDAALARVRRQTGGTIELGYLPGEIDSVRPLPMERLSPELREIGPIVVNPGEPGLVLITELYDPEWSAQWVDEKGQRRAGIVKSNGRGRPGGLMLVEAPGPGAWRLRLQYEGWAARQGLAVSIVAWSVWLGAWGWKGWSRRRQGMST